MTATNLIAEYIEEMPVGARLRKYGVEVWILVVQLRVDDGDIGKLAAAYDVPREAVEAALAYYAHHKELIDAQILIYTAQVAEFYLDHNVAREIAGHLRDAGHGARTARSMGMEQADDDAHLSLAARSGWIFVTHNSKDFMLLRSAWSRWSREWGVDVHHAGIVIPMSTVPRLRIAHEVAALVQTKRDLADSPYAWQSRTGWVRQDQSALNQSQ